MIFFFLVYRAISDHHPYYKIEGSKEEKEWQNAIRHNLSLGKKLFTKVPREGKGSLWLLKPGVELSSSKKTAGKTKKSNEKNANNPPNVQNIKLGRPNIQYKDLVILATLLGYGDILITDEICKFICEILPYFATLEGPAKTKW